MADTTVPLHQVILMKNDKEGTVTLTIGSATTTLTTGEWSRLIARPVFVR